MTTTSLDKVMSRTAIKVPYTKASVNGFSILTTLDPTKVSV